VPEREDAPSISVRVTGAVQGVGFRAWARTHFSRLGLSGHALNHNDGSVRIVVSGDRAALEQLLALLANGSSPGTVRSVDVDQLDDDVPRPPV